MTKTKNPKPNKSIKTPSVSLGKLQLEVYLREGILRLYCFNHLSSYMVYSKLEIYILRQNHHVFNLYNTV